ncbi:hypothetical protein GOBAR_DD12989 [Gossypium barbadense]|nr:hypothetical protein GOBAR_DD12989 [Gossypium barbadense]
MFESQTAIASSHSPHLRKPGSKSVSSDLGAGEPGNSVQEGYVFPLTVGEMKASNSPMHTTAIMPSPIFLWRFKIGWDSVMRMSADLRDLFLYEAFLYYNPLLLVTMMVWLWGVCLWVFSQSTINYAKIFDLDSNHLTHREIWKCSIWMTVIVPTSMTAYLYLYSHGEVALAASQPPISFPDFFLADILTSMAKKAKSTLKCIVLWYFLFISNWLKIKPSMLFSTAYQFHGLLIFGSSMKNKLMVATIAWFEADSVCGSHSVAIPLVLVIPYIWRLLQCLRQYKDTKEKPTLFNGNTSSVFTRIFKFNKPSLCTNLFYGRRWVYFWVIGSNLILRCTWTYKLSAHLRHNYLTVFMVTALEMLRRFQWIFFRVENEWNKITKSGFQIPMVDMPREEEKLLGSTNHNV